MSGGHVVLLGDSIFDNGSYTRGEPDVIGHLRTMLPLPWEATLLARDGAVASSVRRQLAALPADATHLVMSVGGNDALANMDLLNMPVRSTSEALRMFADRLAPFETAFRDVVGSLVASGRDTTVCTIYNGALEPQAAALARVGLMTFNDVILRTALEYRTNIIDLRAVCTHPEDYANPIEPSGAGGRKIAAAITRILNVSPGVATVRVAGLGLGYPL